MKRCLAMLCGLTLLLAAAAGADDNEDERVEELMERTHEGRRSPYGRLRRAVDGEAMPWPAVEQAVREFEPMTRALQQSPVAEIRDSADGYADAVRDIGDAVRARDAEAVRTSFRALTQSCADCHFEGGVGGELDDDASARISRRIRGAD